jgi:sugar phosphate isomerase/epimerase
MLRRTFLQSSAAAPAAALQSAAGGGVKLGFDTYSIRAYRWKAAQFLDYSASLKLDTIQFSSLGDYESLEPAYLKKVREQAERLGISIDAGMGCICPSSAAYNKKDGDPVANIIKGLEAAKMVGSHSMRCFMGSSADRRGTLPIEAHMENTIKVFRAARSRAQDLGVRIALENHSGDMQARELRTIIEESGKDYVGACLDAGNPILAVEDPLVSLEVLHPYVITTHIRDTAVFEHPRGAAWQWVALGDGSIDLPRFVDQFRRLCPKASVQLEIITGRAPAVLPYLEADFWKAFPKANAAEFARFLVLAKNGRPFLGNMLMAGWGKLPPGYEEALKSQQKVDLERSLEYAKSKLGLGIRGRG